MRAASAARFSPAALPIPISADPASRMIVRTSAKSRLTSPGTVIRSVIPWTPWRSTSSAMPERLDERRLLLDHLEQPVVLDHDQRVDVVAELLDPGLGLLGAHAPLEGERACVTTPTVSAPSSAPSAATIGAAPVPVPPPSPAVTKIMSAPLSASFSSSRVSGRGGLPDRRVGAGAEAARDLRADVDLHVGVAHQQRLRVGVDRDELDAGQAGLDHAVDGVRAAAADADTLMTAR